MGALYQIFTSLRLFYLAQAYMSYTDIISSLFIHTYIKNVKTRDLLVNDVAVVIETTNTVVRETQWLGLRYNYF